MQIQYCDTCNLRIDSDEATTINGRIYCRTCAASQAPSGKTAVGSSGSQRTSPSGSGIQRASPAGSGVQRAASSGSARVTPNQLRRASPPGGIARKPSGANQIPKTPARTPPRGNATQMRPSAGAANASGGRRGVPAKTGGNPLLVWGLAGAGIIFAGLVAWLMFRSTESPATNILKPSEQNPSVQKPSEPKLNENTPSPVKSAEATTNSPAPDGRKESASAFTTGFDAREFSAQTELDAIKQYESSPGKNDFELRRRYEKMLARSSITNTVAGKEAAERFKKLAPLGERAADNPTNTLPGLQVTWFELKQITWDSLKSTPLGTKTIENIDLPDRDRLGQVFSRPENIVMHITGYVEAPRDGNYTFFTTSDDGSLLYIGDMLVVNNDGFHGAIEKGDTILLKAGKHQFKVDYYQGGGTGSILVSWSGPGVNKETIPASVFSH